MKFLVTGTNSSGDSFVEAASDVEFAAGEQGVRWAILSQTEASPPPQRAPGNAELLNVGVGAGLARWFVSDFEPNAFFDLHHTDTVDFNILVSGTCQLVLNDGEHELVAGDCVVMNGVDHGWRAGPEGCRWSTILLGTPPLNDGAGRAIPKSD